MNPEEELLWSLWVDPEATALNLRLWLRSAGPLLARRASTDQGCPGFGLTCREVVFEFKDFRSGRNDGAA